MYKILVPRMTAAKKSFHENQGYPIDSGLNCSSKLLPSTIGGLDIFLRFRALYNEASVWSTSKVSTPSVEPDLGDQERTS